MAAETPWVLGDSSWKTVRDAHYQVAVLPWGATEAHNFHLPYGTDTIQSERVAQEAARLAWHVAEPGDHAGEMETSVVQHLAAGMVAPLSDAGDGRARRFRIRALREGWAWARRRRSASRSS